MNKVGQKYKDQYNIIRSVLFVGETKIFYEFENSVGRGEDTISIEAFDRVKGTLLSPEIKKIIKAGFASQIEIVETINQLVDKVNSL